MNRDMYYDFSATAARSPGSMRQGYATVGLPSGLGGNRQGQRPLDSHSQHAAAYGHDDRLGGASPFEAAQRYERINPNQMHSGYMVDNSQTWGYNGGIATLNGPMNGNNRLGGRAVNRRAALPAVSNIVPFSLLIYFT